MLAEIDAILQAEAQKQSLTLLIISVQLNALNDWRCAAFDALQIFMDVAGIRPARVPIVTGCRNAEGPVRRARPVFQVVARGEAGPRPVRDFVMLVTVRR